MNTRAKRMAQRKKKPPCAARGPNCKKVCTLVTLFTKVLTQKFFHGFIEFKAVFFISKTVAFIFF